MQVLHERCCGLDVHKRSVVACVLIDAAFIAVDVKREGDAAAGALAFRLNTDEFVIAGPDHPLMARGTVDAPGLYLAVRHGCEARLNRSTWAQLAEMKASGLVDIQSHTFWHPNFNVEKKRLAPDAP